VSFFHSHSPLIIINLNNQPQRRQCKTRLETHFKNVEAVIGYYGGCCVEVDGNRSMDAVFASVARAIDEAK
jgi:adenylate kinase family enzyme